jgi:hypothetical protein
MYNIKHFVFVPSIDDPLVCGNSHSRCICITFAHQSAFAYLLKIFYDIHTSVIFSSLFWNKMRKTNGNITELLESVWSWTYQIIPKYWKIAERRQNPYLLKEINAEVQIKMRMQIPECNAIWNLNWCKLPKIPALHTNLHSFLHRSNSPPEYHFKMGFPFFLNF